MKKSIKALALSTISLLCALVFTACGLFDGESPEHTHTFGEWAVTTAATCETTGVETKVCKDNSAHTETQTIPALGHNWGAWTETTAPTATVDGVETRICTRDGSHTDTRSVPATGEESFRILAWHGMELYVGEEFTNNCIGTYSESASLFGIRDEGWMTISCSYVPFGSAATVGGGFALESWSVVEFAEAREVYLSSYGEILEQATLVESPAAAEPYSVMRYNFVTYEYLQYVFKGDDAFYMIVFYSQLSTTPIGEYETRISNWMSLTNFNK